MTALMQARAITSFRPLLLFWVMLCGLMAGGVIGLQFIGPLPQGGTGAIPKATPRPHAVQAAPSMPASVMPSTAHPAPAVKLSAASIPEPDPAMLEDGTYLPDRMLPKVGADLRRPAVIYAAAFDPAERHPRVALVLDGAGLDRALTMQAIETLPSAIDLAFSAYAPDTAAATLASQARRGGRECLVSIPMEPSGYPQTEEGSRALTLGATQGQNRQNLEWALSNVAGCVGATGASDGAGGERFAESADAYASLLGELDHRGLLYLDPRPPGDAAGPGTGGHRPFQADMVIDRSAALDEPADAQAIDRRLAALAQLAAHEGSAIGVAGPPTPVLLDRLAVWAHALAAQGIVLAPLSAMPPPRAAVQQAAP